MRDYVILTNRKRAFIALIHSVAFCLIALRAAIVPSKTLGLVVALRQGAAIAGPLALSAIFLIVSCILLWLFLISRCARERLYFGLCTISASTGLLRALVGDPAFHSSNYIRLVMLLAAVTVGSIIWREHSGLEFSRE